MLNRLFGGARILWRDFVMKLSDATFAVDDYLAAFFFTDTAYQYTWSRLDVHQTLLKDEVRVRAFEEAIRETVRPGDRVLDVGTGTGILAFLAARAGASEVVGVDSASVISVAREAAERTGVKNVRFVRCDLRDLPPQNVDLVICELLGMHVTDEGITYKMANARRHLRQGGRMMPDRIEIWVAPVESKDAGMGYWGKVHGVDYSGVDRAPKEIRNYDLGAARLLAEPERIASIDLTASDEPKISFNGSFRIVSAGEFHGLAMWFEARLSGSVTLSTDPRKPLTHWKQIFLPSERRIPVKAGDRLGAEVKAVLRNTKWRWGYRLN